MTVRQFSSCCGESTTKQLSITVRPVSTPAPNCTPEPNRVSTRMPKKSDWPQRIPLGVESRAPLFDASEPETSQLNWLCSPEKFDACVTKLFTRPNFAGAMSYRPQT